MRIIRFMTGAALPACLVVMAEARLHAYIDPGSGPMLWQSLLAGLVGAAFLLRKLIKRLTFWSRPSRNKKDESKSEP